jgi:hypothetical protein
MCLVATVSARLDQAHDAMVDLMTSGTVQATAAVESSIRLEEGRFWMQTLEALARQQGARHLKRCRT